MVQEQPSQSLYGFSIAQVEDLLAANLELEALLIGVTLGKQIQKDPDSFDKQTKIRAITALRQAVYHIKERNRLQSHTASVLSVSFSPDGQTLASASDDGAIKLWNFDLDNLLEQGCRWLQNYLATSPDAPFIN